LILHTPWVELTVDAALPRSASDWNRLLTALAEYPISQTKPRRLSRDRRESAAALDLKLLRMPLPRRWRWEVAEVLDHARIGRDDYDSLAAYTAIRRLRLRQEIQSGARLAMLQHLETAARNDEPLLFRAVATLARQTLHVTQLCERSVMPARRLFPPASIDAFIASERGHDRLLQKTLDALGMDARLLPLFEETKRCMRILRFVATRSRFAFANVVASLEGVAAEGKDPVGAVLERSSRPKAAEWLHRHYRINAHERHGDFGEQLAETMGRIDADSIVAAMRLTELNEIAQDAIAARVGNIARGKE